MPQKLTLTIESKILPYQYYDEETGLHYSMASKEKTS